MSAVAPSRGDCLVEIGPGLGALTDPLLERVDHLHVVEIDRDIIARLQKRYSPERLTIHSGDALVFRFREPRPAAARRRQPAVQHLHPAALSPGELRGHIVDMHFMLQKEVVERMVAAPETVRSAACR